MPRHIRPTNPSVRLTDGRAFASSDPSHPLSHFSDALAQPNRGRVSPRPDRGRASGRPHRERDSIPSVHADPIATWDTVPTTWEVGTSWDSNGTWDGNLDNTNPDDTVPATWRVGTSWDLDGTWDDSGWNLPSVVDHEPPADQNPGSQTSLVNNQGDQSGMGDTKCAVPSLTPLPPIFSSYNSAKRWTSCRVWEPPALGRVDAGIF